MIVRNQRCEISVKLCSDLMRLQRICQLRLGLDEGLVKLVSSGLASTL
jgi:hypothetical protein